MSAHSPPQEEKAGMVGATPADKTSRSVTNDNQKYRPACGMMKLLPAHMRSEMERLVARYSYLGVDVNLATIGAGEALILFYWLSNLGK